MIELIPAIDIIDGKCVRLSQGDYDSKKVYNENSRGKWPWSWRLMVSADFMWSIWTVRLPIMW